MRVEFSFIYDETLNKVFSLFVIVVLSVVSGYLIFQCSNVVAYYNFSKNTILATHLVNAELLDTSRDTLAKGYFTSSFTFDNPTNQTLNLTRLAAEYYLTSGSVRMWVSSLVGSKMLGPGKTPIILQINVNPNTLLLPQPFYWMVKYSLKFGSAHYSFTSSTYTSDIRTIGPFNAGDEQAYTQTATYTLLVVDVWAVGLEAMAALILFQERKTDKTLGLLGWKAHSQMLATAFALQGFGLLVFWPFTLYLRDTVVYQPPIEFPYGLHGVAGLAAFFLMAELFVVGLVFMGTAVGLLLRQRAAKTAALILASISALLSLWGGVGLLTSSPTAQNTALATLLFATAAANGITLYTLLRSTPITESSVKQPA